MCLSVEEFMFEILSKNDVYQKAAYENCEQRLHMFFGFILRFWI